MIFFKKLRYKNILSTGNSFTEIDLAQNPTTLVIGQNGSGKSTFLDALSFALFGKPFRKINKPQLVNSITRKDMVVEIEFQVGRVNYTIVRGMKPNVLHSTMMQQQFILQVPGDPRLISEHTFFYVLVIFHTFDSCLFQALAQQSQMGALRPGFPFPGAMGQQP